MSTHRAPVSLADLRRKVGVSHAELADRLGIKVEAVRKAEKSPDPRISSLDRFVAGLGGELRLVAVMAGREYSLQLDGEPEPSDHAIARSPEPAWRVRAWGDPRLEEAFLDQGVIAVSEDDIGCDVREIPSDDELRRRISDKHPDRSAIAIGIFITYWRDFSEHMQIDDTVVLPLTGGRAAIGVASGHYDYDPSQDARLRHRRPVQWLRVIERHELDNDLLKTVNSPGTICRFGAQHAGSRLQRLARSAAKLNEQER